MNKLEGHDSEGDSTESDGVDNKVIHVDFKMGLVKSKSGEMVRIERKDLSIPLEYLRKVFAGLLDKSIREDFNNKEKSDLLFLLSSCMWKYQTILYLTQLQVDLPNKDIDLNTYSDFDITEKIRVFELKHDTSPEDLAFYKKIAEEINKRLLGWVSKARELTQISK